MRFLTLPLAYLAGQQQQDKDAQIAARTNGIRSAFSANQISPVPSAIAARMGPVQVALTANQVDLLGSQQARVGPARATIIAAQSQQATLSARARGGRVLFSGEQLSNQPSLTITARMGPLRASAASGLVLPSTIAARSGPPRSVINAELGGAGPYPLVRTDDLYFWFNSQTGVTTDANGLTDWEDLGPFESNFVRSSKLYTVVPNALNGFQVLRSQVDATLNRAPAGPSVNTWTLFAVVAAAGDTIVFGWGSNNRQARVGRLNVNEMSYFSGSFPEGRSTPLPESLGDWAIHVWRQNGSTLDMWQSGVNVYSGSVGSQVSVWDRLGGMGVGTEADFDISDGIAWSAAVPDQEIHDQAQILAAKYQLPWSTT